MRIIFNLILISSITALIWALGPYNTSHPAYPDKCFIRPDLILNAMEKRVDPENCLEYYCLYDGELYNYTCYESIYWFHNYSPKESFCKYGTKPVFKKTTYPHCCMRQKICYRNFQPNPVFTISGVPVRKFEEMMAFYVTWVYDP